MSDGARRRAAAVLGAARTPRKAEASRRNGLRGGHPGILVALLRVDGEVEEFGSIAELLERLGREFPGLRLGRRWGAPRINVALEGLGMRVVVRRGKGRTP